MELSLMLMEQIFAMVLIMVVGFVFVRTHILEETDTKVLSKIVLYAACPCTIVASFLMDYSAQKAQGFLICAVAAVLVHILFIALSVPSAKLFGFNPIEKTSLMATNAGYILIPLVSATLGSEYVFYSSAFIAVQTVVFWTYLQAALGHKEMVNVKKVLLNPNILAIAVGLVLFFGRLGLPTIPESAVSNMGDATGALTMLIIGMSIGNANLKESFSSARCYLVVALRLVVFPAVVVVLIWASRICEISPVAEKALICTVLASAAPVAAAITQFAELYDITPRRAGIINVLSVFGCIVTMPLMLWLYQYICT